MVLGYINDVAYANKHHIKLFFYSFVYATLGLFLAYWTFASQSSLLMVFLTVLFVIPFFYSAIKSEEESEYTSKDFNELSILEHHAKIIYLFLVLFLGITAALTFWYV